MSVISKIITFSIIGGFLIVFIFSERIYTNPSNKEDYGARNKKSEIIDSGIFSTATIESKKITITEDDDGGDLFQTNNKDETDKQDKKTNTNINNNNILTTYDTPINTNFAEIPTNKEISSNELSQTNQEQEQKNVLFSTINQKTREALVNIFCVTKSGGIFKPASGSGIIIDKRGIILTNAHVAQYFLLKDYLEQNFIECIVRVGSPARALYKVEPIFISPSWIQNNADNITQQSPTGTGEDDYALLLITEYTDKNKTLPKIFPFISPLYNSGDISIGEDVLLAAYPAGFLSGISIAKDLYISSAITKIIGVFTFKEGALDLFSIGGSIVAQQGSSGGAVVNRKNELLGIIVTSSEAENTQDRDLRAITIAHINRSFMKDTGFDLQTLFSGNIKAEVDAFNKNIATELTRLLVSELEK